MTFTLKSFYEMFYPQSCPHQGKQSSDCIYSIKNWQAEFGLAVCLPALKKYPTRSSECHQFYRINSDLKQPFTKFELNSLKISNKFLKSLNLSCLMRTIQMKSIKQVNSFSIKFFLTNIDFKQTRFFK